MSWMISMELILGEDGAFKVVGEGYNSGQGGCWRTGSKDKCTNIGLKFPSRERFSHSKIAIKL